MDEISDEDVQFGLIMDAFLRKYSAMCEGVHEILEKADETERREALRKFYPRASKLVERHTQEELRDKLWPYAIAASVASAILEAKQILE